VPPRSDRAADTIGRAEQGRCEFRVACGNIDRGQRLKGPAKALPVVRHCSALDRLAKLRESGLEVAEPVVNPAQIDEGVAQENLGLNRADMLEGLFEVRDCVGIPVVLQQRTTEIQRREREAPLIIKFAEGIGSLCK
jgi:hypothetical protein